MIIRESKNVVMALTAAAVIGVGSWAWAEPTTIEEAAKPLLTHLEAEIEASDLVSAKTKELIKKELLPLCINQTFIKETLLQNKQQVALDEIKAIDKQWIDAEDELAIQQEKTSNACAAEIKKIAVKNAMVAEAFVMCNQGAVVGENVLTSDYWQGDEDKWTDSFNKGKGGLHIGKVKHDKSTDKNLQQVSLPIIGEEGEVIGAVTWGLIVESTTTADASPHTN